MAVIVAVAGALGACATSNVGTARAYIVPPARFMAAAGPATPPAGFIDFCARSPRDCGLAAEAGPQLAPVAVIGAADAPAAGARARRGFYDWSSAFAAARPAPVQAPQAAALRQELYGRMWQAAFAAARPQAATPVLQAAAAVEAAPPLPRPYAVKAAWSWSAAAPTWTQVSADEAVATPAAYDQAPAATEAAYSEPAAAAQPQVQPQVQPLAVTRALMAELVAVDRRVNRKIVQTDDLRLYGQDDYWATPIEDALSPRGLVRGDCEDYALEKRRALIAAGVPAEALAIATADTPFGPHAVLLVDTDQGELVLDSLSGRIKPWDRTGYRWIKRQAWGDPMSWVQLAAY